MLLLLSALAACSPDPSGASYRGAVLPVTDLHLHPGDWKLIPGSTQAYLAERFPFPFGLRPAGLAEGTLAAEGILDEMDAAGVARSGLFAVYAPRSVGVAPNSLVLEATAVDPARLLGFASLSVDDWAEHGPTRLAALEAALASERMVGIKLAHAHQHFRMDDAAYFAIYDVAAAFAAPVYLHTGNSPFPGTSREAPYTDPRYLRGAFEAHPDTTFILGHMGHDFVADTSGRVADSVALAAEFDNVYLEPSALGSRGGDPEQVFLPEALRLARDAGVVDKVIYGSDGPQSPGFIGDYLARTLYAMDVEGYAVDEAALVLDGNFSRVFGVDALERP